MEKMHSFFLFMAAGILALSGCAGVPVRGNVQDNVFTSTYSPKITVKISPDLTYMGKSEVTRRIPTIYGQYAGETVRVLYIRYLFCETWENREIRKMCSIILSRILDEYTVQPKAPLKGAKFDITPGELDQVEVNLKEPYQAVEDPLSYGINRYVYEAGLTMDLSTAGCYLIKPVAREISVDSRTLLVIYYAEQIEKAGTCREWNKPVTILTDAQKERIGTFLRNSDEYVHILSKGE